MQSWNIETAPGKTVRNFELGSLCALLCCLCLKDDFDDHRHFRNLSEKCNAFLFRGLKHIIALDPD